VQPQQVLARLALAPEVLAPLASLVLEQSTSLVLARLASLVLERLASLVLVRLASLAQEHQASLVPERLALRTALVDHPQDRQDPSSWARRWDPDLALRLACQKDPDLVQNWDPARGRPALPSHVV
jgi:hypothetical protein